MESTLDNATVRCRFWRPRFPVRYSASIGSLMSATALVFLSARSAGAELFPFVVSYDSPDNVTNLSGWLEKPAGKHGFVRVEDGHFVTGAGPIRFWGTNLCFDACFPTREQAQPLARRLARLGVNVVRLHHMDSRSIWGKNRVKTFIDPEQLDRLDFLIWQLKQNGIYTNLNLHVSRSLGGAEGFLAQDQRPQYDKGLDNFEPRMIALQEKYARDLLTHRNPYTGELYSREPAIAFVEINNENALFDQWSGGNLDELPEPYSTTFRQLWGDWLRAKYGTTDRLRAAWSGGEQPLGEELLTNGNFRQPLGQEWGLERDPATEVTWTIAASGLADQPSCLRTVVIRQGNEPWRPQFSQAGLSVVKGRAYTLSFWIRADRECRLSTNCMMAHDPWQRLGLSANVTADTSWTRKQFTFVADRDDMNARITFTDFRPGTYELSGVSLRPGGIVGLQVGETIAAEQSNVPVQRRSDNHRTVAARRDFIDFLWDTEQSYWSGMHDFLARELAVNSLVSGTQLNYSPIHIQAALDYIDAHAYWQHPHFPNKPWDRNDWYVEDVALVNSPGGTLTSLASRRVAGKPFTVSEYNHPAPNSYAAEGLPMLATMAAFQGWDGLYSFAYSHDTDFEPTRLSSYFDIKGDPAKLVHMPAAVALFVRADLAPAEGTTLVPLSRETERKKLHDTGDPWRLTMAEFGQDAALPLSRKVAWDLTGSATRTSPTPTASSWRWTVPRPGKGQFIVSTTRTKLFTGFATSEGIDLGDVQLRVGSTQLGWATVSLTCIDGDGFSRPGRILIAASGYQQNSNAKREQLNATRITLRGQWGDSPLLCEGIPAEITLPVAADRVRCFALDEAGNRGRALNCQPIGNSSTLRLDPVERTLWYEVMISD